MQIFKIFDIIVAAKQNVNNRTRTCSKVRAEIFAFSVIVYQAVFKNTKRKATTIKAIFLFLN